MIVRVKQTTSGHREKWEKGTCRKDVKRLSFPYRTVETWNALDGKVIEVTTHTHTGNVL